MNFLFGHVSSPKVPKVSPPPALPQTQGDMSDLAMQLAKKRSGFEKTIVAGNLQPAPTGKKRLLGGP
jgi:hypothetical protein